jgi:hypothetical protein
MQRSLWFYVDVEAMQERLDPVREVLTDRRGWTDVPVGAVNTSVPPEARAGARRASRSRRSRWPALTPGPEAALK